MLKYQQLAQQLMAMIQQNSLPQGAKLPSLNELKATYQTSKTTILKALTELERAGLIYQVQGSGTFVRKPPKAGYLNFSKTNHGWTNDLEDNQLTNADVTVQKIYPTVEVAQYLHCLQTTPVYQVQRVKLAQGVISCWETSYYNTEEVPFLDVEIATGSIFHYLQQVHQIKVGFSDKYFAVRPLTALEAQKLALTTTSFGLVVQEVFYSTSGRIFDYSQNVYNYQTTKFYL